MSEEKLYDSVVAFKMSIGGRPPPLTPIPERLLDTFNPEFCGGLGHLYDDWERGQRCPYVGCGIWTHTLANHTASRHFGADHLRRLLQLPPGAPLISRQTREKRSRAGRKGAAARNAVRAASSELPVPPKRKQTRAGRRVATLAREKKQREHNGLMGVRNLHQLCTKQVVDRVLQMRDKIGRLPNEREAAILNQDLVSALPTIGWTWDVAVAVTRLSTGLEPEYRLDDAALLVGLWYDNNPQMRHPRLMEWGAQDTTPPLPSRDVICKAAGVRSFRRALIKVSRLAGITDPLWVGRDEPWR